MSALRRLVCRLFGHAPATGLTRSMAISFHCARCGGFEHRGPFLTARVRR